jgi:hypothetical protein
MLFRLLTTGLCVACVVILATIQPVQLPCADRVPPVAHEASPFLCREGGSCGDRSPPVSVVDVAGGVAPEVLAQLVHLRPDERISAINDRALDSEAEAGALIASLAPHAGEFLDLTVSSTTTERRVLMLMH